MSTRVAERLDDWDSRSFTGGTHELQELADADFSGVIRAGGAELYMTTGTVVGIERGSIDDFADAQGTVFVSPSPALPLLAVMQAEDVDVRAQYYSEDTPMSEVDRTLSDGAFTGYIELSENVLSGDYYVVYHGGERMAVGFVGNSARLLTDEEAFETADDEVGIYKVRQVEIEPIEIPDAGGESGTGAAEGNAGETEASAAEAGAAGAAGGAGAAASTADPETASTAGADEGADAAAEPRPETGDAAATAEDEAGAEEAAAEPAATSTPERAGADEPGEGAEAESTESEPTETGASGAEPTESGASGTDASDGAAETGGASDTATDDTEAPSTAEPNWQGSQSERESAETGQSGTADATTASGAAPQRERAGDQSAASSRGERSGSEGASAEQAGQPREGASRGPDARHGGTGGHGASQRTSPERQPAGSGGGAATGGGSGAGSGGSATDLETRSIPSLDPNLTKTPQRSTGGRAARDTPARGGQSGGAAASQQGRAGGGANRQQARQQQPGGADGAAGEAGSRAGDAAGAAAGAEGRAEAERGSGESSGAAAERVDDLQAQLEEREAEVDRLETELERVETEKDDLREQLESARQERDELAEQVDRLESELTRLEEELGAATDAEQRITAREALDGTDVFVRYRSKGDATLQKAHDGSVRQKDVTGNLRLEKHTQFDAARVAVGGKSYHEFLEARPEYQFIRWTVEELLFEIRDTGHGDALQVLYDALPKVDRGELNGVIEVTFTDEGQETRTQETFDVVLRDRMGNPLLVANLNDSRQGATETMMSDLITAAERVGQSADTFAGAFLVTRSFFEPDALETADEATRSGIFSRDKRKSFVNISRKRGFHLCLVEARNKNFHLTVPEL